jgi:GH43 family beta-xylosidase
MPPLVTTSPVYPGAFADPFVWRHGDHYFAVGTGPPADEGTDSTDGDASPRRVIPLLRSADLVTWERLPDALERPDIPEELTEFWAPEVAVHDGPFYLYYSVGRESKHHELRVAVSDTPDGPYRDTGAPLLRRRADAASVEEHALYPFAIDPHPVQDDDGQWYLFYAADFLDSDGDTRAGTALVVDRLITMTRLAGEPRTVLRARFDWQRHRANHLIYGRRFDWHTLEGPFIRKRQGRYWCFYSGGCWQTADYGVDYAVADHILGPYSDAGAEDGPRVLRAVPGQVRGPGHNCVILGPDGRTEYIVYHAWDEGMTARRMCLDPLVWTPAGPRCPGSARGDAKG